jgi:valyl-tRNA synthetase
MARAEQELAGVLRKLENPNFVAKAPPDVVEKDRARVEELKARKTKLQENLTRLSPEAAMATPTDPVSTTVSDPETAQVKVAPPSAPAGEGVDLSKELKSELDKEGEVVNPQVTDALNKLREGTKEGLSATDHHDLGVAYMSMGLVDDAMREFDKAKQGGDERAAPEQVGSRAPKAGKPSAARKALAKVAKVAKKALSQVAKKVSGKKAPVPTAKKALAKPQPPPKPAARKPLAKKAAAKKLVVKKAVVKKAVAKKGTAKKPAMKKATGKSAPSAKTPVRKAAAKKAGKKTPAKARR